MEQEFKEILLATKIPNMDKLIKFLSSTDFFVAPASTKFHDSKPRGLLEHSMNVYKILKDKVYNYNKIHPENAISCASVALTALLHDVCKINYYKLEYRNVKDERGYWEKKPYYTVEDTFPYGHGEKSVYLINKYITLTDEQAFAIRWHMRI